uniref:Uncharacterized protein KIAA1109 n=1 Tax=Cacopsylla melanoneura TaxID=428564 RepID=A0A8D9BQV3_9HEMI
MGFIMMECGLEGVSFKVVKRAKFEREEDNPPGADPNSTTGKDITSTTLTKTNAKDSTQNSLNKAAKDNTNISNKANAKDTPQNSMNKASAKDNTTSLNKANAKDTTHNSLSKANETSGESVESKPVRDDVSSETINIANVKAEDSSSTPKGTRAPATPGATSTTDNVSSTQPNPPNDTSKALVPVIDANASSCVIDVKSVWFNFAAPPRTPITRSKIAYTRLDWNLLSTASPGITAWMNPSNRCVIRAVHALRCRYRRSTAVVTCLMSQALDESSVHMPDKSRYGRFTPMAKALQEDPSCQLCNILRKYLLQSPIGIESNLKEPDLPHLSTLRQGVIVLSRQWKNILYTPLLLEHNFKIKNHPLKPMNVTFAIPDPEEEQMTDDPDDCDPDTEVTDECAMLLHSQFKPPHGIIKLPAPPSGGDEGSTTMSPPPHHQSSPTSPLTQNRTQIGSRKTKRLPPSQAPSSSRASIVFPLLTGGGSAHHHYRHLSDHKPALGGYASLKDEERLRCNAQSSNPSLYSSIPLPPAGPDSLGSLEQAMLTSPPHTSSHHNDGKEDLYAWMAKQQADTDEGELSDALSKSGKTNYWDTTKLGASSTVLAPGSLPPGVTAQSPPLASPDLTLLGPGGFSLYPMHDNLRLLDAHLIFEPLLASLGVMPQQMITNSSSGNAPPVGSSGGSLDSWGSNLSVSASMVSMRVDIVESEVDKMNNHATDAGGKKKEKGVNEDGSGSGGAKFRLDLPPDTGAFLCERVHIGCEVRRAADLTLVEDLSRQRRNMLYVSRGQLKKHANTALNVSVSVRYISQQVTMPLLRLLHQISNMYTNVKVTQSELRDSVAPPLAKSPAPPPLGGRLPSELFDKHKALVQQDVKPVVSPSASVRSKHQSFVQKLRSTSKSVRGYMNLGDPPPRDTLLPGSTPLTETRPGAPPLGGTPEPLAKPDELLPPLSTPRCWKTVYYLLDLYATMPETKTVAHRISMGAADVTDNYKINPGATTTPNSTTGAKKPDDIDVEKGDPGVNVPQPSTPTLQLGQQVAAREERARLIVFAVARIHRTRLLATLSGLKLEAEITNLHSSLTYRKKTRPPSLECSLTGHLGRTMIVLLEGVAPNQQTVVKVTVDKSQALISSLTRRSKDKNSGFITIDRINIDIPQHPVVLHGMMTRGSKQLSSTLQELRVTRTSSRMSRGTTIDEVTCSAPAGPDSSPPNKSDPSPPHHKEPPPRPPPPVLSSSTGPTGHSNANVTPAPAGHSNVTTNTLLQPFVMHFTGLIQSVTFTAALLPSLQAQYRMDQLSSTGVTGSKAKFVVDLPRHSLSFSTKVQVIEANLPSEASIDLPKIHVSAEYVQDGGNRQGDLPFTEGVTYKLGSYMSAMADIGIFEHSLTTDLLNHLVFVQKVFMKEVNEVIQKVYGGEKPVPIWEEDEPSSVSLLNYILFSLVVRVKRVQLTATTPTNSAVRLETGLIELQLSNRIQNMSGASSSGAGAKLFLQTNVDVNLSLGQVIRNALFEEAEPEFQQYAFFKTKFALRNAFQGEMINSSLNNPGGNPDDKEVILISLTRPLIYIQPVAVDKAILVWLNYKNAYDYWTEQCTDPSADSTGATMSNLTSGLEKFSVGPNTSTMGTLFLHLTVDDMGICVPLNPLPLQTTWGLNRNRSYLIENDSCSAVVITLESTSIEACSSGSLVSKGQFIGLCLRFADDFETSLDDWKPDPSLDSSALMNLCVVSEGTYEVCSRTTTLKSDTENAKWFLNVKWQMEGVDIHLDVNIGKQLSALGHTLTTLTGVQEDQETFNAYCDSDDDDDDDDTNNSQDSIMMKSSKPRGGGGMGGGTVSCEPLSPHLDPKKKSKLLEKEMLEQVKVINDLHALGASQITIEQEMRRLSELEAQVFRGFRRNMIQKLRRQSSSNKADKAAAALALKSTSTSAGKESTSRASLGGYRTKGGPCTGSLNTDLHTAETEAAFGHELLGGVLEAGTLEDELRFKTGSLKHHRVTFSETAPSLSRQPSLPSGTNSTRDSIDDLKSSNSYSEMSKLSEDSDEEANTQRMNAGGNGSSGAGTNSGVDGVKSQQQPKPQEPNIDFELDVKVFINRGKCVLHTKDNTRDDDPKLMSKIRKEKSWVGGVSDPGSPNMSRRSTRDSRPMSSSKMNRHSTTHLQELTIFHIPGLDVKVHYESRTVPDEGLSPRYSIDHNGIITRKSSTKKASLYAWTTLHSIPEETIISPHILEFLEQTLEPIPQDRLGGGMHTMFDLGSDGDAPMPGQYVYASFPVDVIVYFHMQPSTFRFSCLPVSRVACLLQLPSLHLVFSSKRAEGNQCPEQGVAVGGLSITGCLADFSVYIFHPYGGKKTAGTSSANTSGVNPSSSNAQHPFSPLSETERKDSLSVNVEFVKLHLSRSRNVTEQTRGATIRFSTIVDIGSASFKYDMRRLTEILAFPKAWYRRNIMRRMFLGGDYPTRPSTSVFEPSDFDSSPEAELELPLHKTSTPKADRYRPGPDPNLKSPLHSESSTESGATGCSSWNTLVLFAVNFKRLNVHMNMGNVMGNVMLLTKDFRSEGRLSVGSTGHKNLFISLGLGGASLDAKGGIVGGTIEISKVDTFILIKEDPSMEPEHTVGVKLWALELRLDYMGSGVVMTRVSALKVTLRDEWKVKYPPSGGGSTPTRRPAMIYVHGDLKWDQLQLMISKSTSTDLSKMYSKLEEFFTQQFKSSKRVFTSLQHTTSGGPVDSSGGRTGLNKNKKLTPGTRKKHVVQPQSQPGPSPPDMAWAKHHRHWQPVLAAVSGLRISHLPSTVLPPWGSVLGGKLELHGSHISLACFHGINFKSKSWALFSLKKPTISFATEAQEVRTSDGSDELDVHIEETLTFSLGITSQSPHVLHHSMATVCRLSRNVLFPPQFRTLHEWFHYAFACSDIDEVDRFPSLEREKENLSASSSNTSGGSHASESVRSRTPKLLETPNHTREVIFALPSLQLHFKTEHLQSSKVPSFTFLIDNLESILKPLVKCSFITEFEDHIFVTVDAEAFFFLHDLITSYIRENKDTNKVLLPGGSLSSSTASGPSSHPRASSPDPSLSHPSTLSSKLNKPATPSVTSAAGADERTFSREGIGAAGGLNLQKKTSDEIIEELNKRDWRNFHCNTWHLEPTVRLLSWGGKSIEPYGVDYILQKLGFTHARTTIPKRMQRGFMEPLDKVLAVLLLRIVAVVREETPANAIQNVRK